MSTSSSCNIDTHTDFNGSNLNNGDNEELIDDIFDKSVVELSHKDDDDKESTEEMENNAFEVIDDSINNCEEEEMTNDDNQYLDNYDDPFLQSSEAEFKEKFKVTRSTFQNLAEFLSKEEMEPIENVPLYKKLLIVLWLVGNSGSYSDAAEMFDVTEEAVANCFFDVCATLYNQCDNIITWPDFDECSEIASRIEKCYGFPGVVGVLGCRYISITIPKELLSRREHFNAKQKLYSVALQIVCDDNLMIRDICPGLPGGVTEKQIFCRSPLFEQLTSKSLSPQLIESHKHILARSMYPQMSSVLTPYSNATGSLSKEESELNELHENVCQLVDQTFDMLQDRFATLKILDPEVATMVIVVTCVIHNFCIANGDYFGIDN